MEFTARSLQQRGREFSSYANVAYSVAQGKGAQSAQFLWPDAAIVNYVNNNWIYLDHDQTVSGSFGLAYTWNRTDRLQHPRLLRRALRQRVATGRHDHDRWRAGRTMGIPNGGERAGLLSR